MKWILVAAMVGATVLSDLLQSSLGGSVQIKTVFRPALWRALVDPSQIELVVLNLAINARDASPIGSTITLETSNATLGLASSCPSSWMFPT